jgi:hypothetical protein
MSNAPILPASLDYTDKDFASIRLRLQALIRSVFPTWTDFNVANFGDILLELFAFTGDILTYYQDNQARESRLVTAVQLQNVIALAQMLGYTVQGAEAAQTEETLTLASPPIGTVTIPKGSVILTANITGTVAFQLLADAFFAAGLNPPTVKVLVENSTDQTDTFTSNGLPNQTFVLSQVPFLDTSNGVPITTFTAADGVYTEVVNFLDSTPTDKHFTVSISATGQATIMTGDGINGSIPSGAITVDYRTGGGSAGNVEPTTISRMQGQFTDSLGNPVAVSATNAQQAQGGLDPQTVAQIQVAAPAGLRSNTRSVSIDDFETNALRVPGAARALMVTSNQDPAVAENTGDLYIVPVGGGVAGVALLNAVFTMVTVTYPSTLTFKVNTFSARYLSVNVFARFYKQKGFTGAQVGANLRATLAAFFAVQNADGTPNKNVDFGANLTDTNGNPAPRISINGLIDACEQTTGVSEIGGNPTDFLLNNAHGDPTLTPEQFPALGTVTLIDGDTGLAV